MPATHSSRAPCPSPSLSDLDSDELSRGNLEVGFRPQKSVKAEREQPPGTPADQPQAGGPEPARGTPDVEAAAQPARPKDGGPVVNPGAAEFQSCSPGWSSAFYEADCFGTDVHNYVKELEGQKAGGNPDTSSPVSAGSPSTPGLGGRGAESKQEFFSQVTTPSAPLTRRDPTPAGALRPPVLTFTRPPHFVRGNGFSVLVSGAPGPGEPSQRSGCGRCSSLGRWAFQALVPWAASLWETSAMAVSSAWAPAVRLAWAAMVPRVVGGREPISGPQPRSLLVSQPQVTGKCVPALQRRLSFARVFLVLLLPLLSSAYY